MAKAANSPEEKEVAPVVADAPAKIKPVVEAKLVPVQVEPEIEVAPGNYLLVRLDKDGNEIPGSEFQIGAFNAEKTYLPLTDKFKVKKSPLK